MTLSVGRLRTGPVRAGSVQTWLTLQSRALVHIPRLPRCPRHSPPAALSVSGSLLCLRGLRPSVTGELLKVGAAISFLGL